MVLYGTNEAQYGTNKILDKYVHNVYGTGSIRLIPNNRDDKVIYNFYGLTFIKGIRWDSSVSPWSLVVHVVSIKTR